MNDHCSIDSETGFHVDLVLYLLFFVCCDVPIHFPTHLHAQVALLWPLSPNCIDLPTPSY